MLMKILLFRIKSTTDMPFRLILIQHLPCLPRQCRIDLQQTLRDVLMYRALAHSEFLRSLPDSRFIFNNIICDFHRPLFNIILQRKTPA